MSLKFYERLLFIISGFLIYEYLIFNQMIHSQSLISIIFDFLNNHSFFKNYFLNLNPRAGYPLSYTLGWLGFGIMCLTNLYIIRKRFGIFSSYGKNSGWLDFHIFCGLLGPILIVFHANFKVNGLVSISFWSMVICSTSGIVGRYFYLQTLKKENEILKYVDNLQVKLKNKLLSHLSEDLVLQTLEDQRYLVLIPHSDIASIEEESSINTLYALYQTLINDIKLKFYKPIHNVKLSAFEIDQIKNYFRSIRRIYFFKPFNKLLGYWHSFHLPFAFFMYIVAIIHIFAALVFGVNH